MRGLNRDSERIPRRLPRGGFNRAVASSACVCQRPLNQDCCKERCGNEALIHFDEHAAHGPINQCLTDPHTGAIQRKIHPKKNKTKAM